MAYPNQKIKNRFLPERSYLYYKYPQVGAERSIEFYFPLLENIDISESQRPNLGTYELLGRNSNLYSFHGAKSRDFTLRFNMTLPNILDYMTNVGLSERFSPNFRYFYNDKNIRQKLFVADKMGRDSGIVGGDLGFNLPKKTIENSNSFEYYNRSKSNFFDLFPTEPANPAEELRGLLQKITNPQSLFQLNDKNNTVVDISPEDSGFISIIKSTLSPSNTAKLPTKTIRDAVNYFMLLVNVIRTSTINNSSNTSLGPPTIYINHGTMYNNIPCVCTNFSIKINQNTGYDLISMSPRQIEISINLSENRVGDFGSFVPFGLIKGENSTGWESIINDGTYDSHNSTFTGLTGDEMYFNVNDINFSYTQVI